MGQASMRKWERRAVEMILRQKRWNDSMRAVALDMRRVKRLRLPREPAGRLDAVTELFQSKLIGPRTAKLALEFRV